jgi:hypothetical protein
MYHATDLLIKNDAIYARAKSRKIKSNYIIRS